MRCCRWVFALSNPPPVGGWRGRSGVEGYSSGARGGRRLCRDTGGVSSGPGDASGGTRNHPTAVKAPSRPETRICVREACGFDTSKAPELATKPEVAAERCLRTLLSILICFRVPSGSDLSPATGGNPVSDAGRGNERSAFIQALRQQIATVAHLTHRRSGSPPARRRLALRH
jgi:hypothetical protein